jgi:hypothetical protein
MAQLECVIDGGYLVEIEEPYFTNSFIDSLVEVSSLENNYHGNNYWSGGIRSYVAGQKFDIWHNSRDMISVNNFLNDTEHVNAGISYGIVLRKDAEQG